MPAKARGRASPTLEQHLHGVRIDVGDGAAQRHDPVPIPILICRLRRGVGGQLRGRAVNVDRHAGKRGLQVTAGVSGAALEGVIALHQPTGVPGISPCLGPLGRLPRAAVHTDVDPRYKGVVAGFAADDQRAGDVDALPVCQRGDGGGGRRAVYREGVAGLLLGLAQEGGRLAHRQAVDVQLALALHRARQDALGDGIIQRLDFFVQRLDLGCGEGVAPDRQLVQPAVVVVVVKGFADAQLSAALIGSRGGVLSDLPAVPVDGAGGGVGVVGDGPVAPVGVGVGVRGEQLAAGSAEGKDEAVARQKADAQVLVGRAAALADKAGALPRLRPFGPKGGGEGGVHQGHVAVDHAHAHVVQSPRFIVQRFQICPLKSELEGVGDVIEGLLQVVDRVAVIAQRVAFRRAGPAWVGCGPHADRIAVQPLTGRPVPGVLFAVAGAGPTAIVMIRIRPGDGIASDILIPQVIDIRFDVGLVLTKVPGVPRSQPICRTFERDAGGRPRFVGIELIMVGRVQVGKGGAQLLCAVRIPRPIVRPVVIDGLVSIPGVDDKQVEFDLNAVVAGQVGERKGHRVVAQAAQEGAVALGRRGAGGVAPFGGHAALKVIDILGHGVLLVADDERVVDPVELDSGISAAAQAGGGAAPPFIPPSEGGTGRAVAVVRDVLKAGGALRLVEGVNHQGVAVGIADLAVGEGAWIDAERVNDARKGAAVTVFTIADPQPVAAVKIRDVPLTGSDQLAVHVQPLPPDGAAKGVHHLVPGAIAIVRAGRADPLAVLASQPGADIAVLQVEAAVGGIAAGAGDSVVAYLKHATGLARGFEPERRRVGAFRGVQRHADLVDVARAVKADGVAVLAAHAGEGAIVVGVVYTIAVVAEARDVGKLGHAGVFIKAELGGGARRGASDVQDRGVAPGPQCLRPAAQLAVHAHGLVADAVIAAALGPPGDNPAAVERVGADGGRHRSVERAGLRQGGRRADVTAGKGAGE